MNRPDESRPMTAVIPIATPRSVERMRRPQATDLSALVSAPLFLGVVFAVTALQSLSNPIAGWLMGVEDWTHPLPLALVVALVVAGCAAQTTSLMLVRRWPVLAMFATLACFLAVAFGLAVPMWTLGMQVVVALTLFVLPTRRSIAASIGWLAVAVAADVAVSFAWLFAVGSEPGLVAGFVLAHCLGFAGPAAAATALGVVWATHARRAADARERAEQVAREHDERLEEARALERGRIAQELHDVTGQHIAGLVSLCDASIMLAPQHPDQAIHLIEEVRAEGRFAAASLYGALGDLRAVDARGIEATPDLRTLDDLIAFWTRRGMPVRAHVLGDFGDLPAVVSTIAYRGVQEALANAAKHAAGSDVVVDVVVRGDRLDVAITNRPGARRSAEEQALGLGWGLDGLRDKLLLLDGTLHAGPLDDGGWRTRIEVPFAMQEDDVA